MTEKLEPQKTLDDVKSYLEQADAFVNALRLMALGVDDADAQSFLGVAQQAEDAIACARIKHRKLVEQCGGRPKNGEDDHTVSQKQAADDAGAAISNCYAGMTSLESEHCTAEDLAVAIIMILSEEQGQRAGVAIQLADLIVDQMKLAEARSGRASQ